MKYFSTTLFAVVWALGACLSLNCSFAQEPSTSDKLKSPGSWSWAPAQADFFWGIHHVDQQIERFQQSSFAQAVTKTSLWNKTNELFLKEWKDRKSDLATWRARLDNPAAREIRAFLYDVVSQDIFLYADENLSRSVEQWNLIAPAVERLSDRETRNEDKAEIVARWVDELVPQVQLPTLMLAGRFSNLDRALARVDEIEGAIRLGITFVPDIGFLFKNLRRVEDKRGNRLEWRITADMFPWDQIPETDILDRETIQDLRKACADKTISFSFGTLDDYFCVVISGDKDWQNRFGSESKLMDLREIQPMISEATQGSALSTSRSGLITSTYHTSDSVVAAFQKFLLDGFFRKIARLVILPILEQQPAESDSAAWLTSVLDDAAWLDDRIGRHVVRYRGASRVAWLSDQSAESVQIDRTPMHLMDSTKPLEGIRRVGTDPLLILNLRLSAHPEYFGTAREIVRRAKSSFDEFMQISDTAIRVAPWKPIQNQLLANWPTVVALTEDWQRRILPNLNGEHLVLVQSGGLQSKRWLPMIGESSALLSVPEAALASGIDNSEEFGAGSISIVNKLGSLLGSYGIYPPVPPRLAQSTEWSLGTLPQSFADPEVGTFQGILATGKKWNWLGYSKTQWERFAQADAMPTMAPDVLLGFDETRGALASAALIDLGALSQLGNSWAQFLLENADLDNEGYLRLPPTSTGRSLQVTQDEINEFLECLNSLGRLTSFSKSTEQGDTLSRSRYTWNSRGNSER